MEKRIAGIIKWLERCLKAVRADSLESALMDVECARADIERLREDVWSTLEGRYAARPRGREKLIAMSFKIAAVAAVFVLASATPIALFSEPAGEKWAEVRDVPRSQTESVILEWVTPDEKTLLGNLRKRLSDGNSVASMPARGTTASATVAARPAETKPQVAGRTQRIEEKTEEKKDNPEAVPYDRILSLVKAGERALKNEEPAIRIER